MRHACPRCGTTTSRKGRCEGCNRETSRPANTRKNQRPNVVEVYSTARWRQLRTYVLRRDASTCQVCGKPATTAGHIHPFQGGTDPLAWDAGNVRAECLRCNSREAGRRGKAA